MQISDDQSSLYVGLMSGTSMDGVDVAVVRFGDHQCDVIAADSLEYPSDLRKALLHAIRQPEELDVDTLCRIDHRVAEAFAEATNETLAKVTINSDDVIAIGSHGQTVRHMPNAEWPFTLQIGDPNIIAARTGITTVADFRRRDLALGGQGAPLAPAFHHWLFGSEPCVIVNIGGIANITVLTPDPARTIGFDTGPGNTLMDAWISRHNSSRFDEAGTWAKSGQVSQPLLDNLLADPYLATPPPKSTGFEYFNLAWLESRMDDCSFNVSLSAEDVQATLAEFSAQTIADAVAKYTSSSRRLLVCGGGAHNTNLIERLRSNLSGMTVEITSDYGLDPDWVEAVAFAWLARQTLRGEAGNLPAVTGASSATVLGGIFAT